MQRVNERDCDFRGGDWGVKYFMRGPRIDWGVILLKPGQSMGEHGHAQVEETFYCLSGAPTLILDGAEMATAEGDVLRIDPPERHDFRNDTDEDVRIIFIKTPYLPQDKT